MDFKQHMLSSIDLFDKGTANELREQILKYQMSSCLTDVERAKLLGLPPTCRMREGAKIISPEKLSIGDHVWIGENAILDASGGLSIGSHTSIGLSVFVWTHSSHLANKNYANYKGSDYIKRKPTKIGNGCFIAGPSVVFPGVTIGDNVIIGPLSAVDRDLKDGEIFGLSHRLKSIEEDIEKLKKTLGH